MICFQLLLINYLGAARLSFGPECNGLCYIQIGTVEVELSFICNQPFLGGTLGGEVLFKHQ